jgi:putative N6-adenine-specific DNA methylase
MDEQELFAAAAPGLERVVAKELSTLGLKPKSVEGGASFAGGDEAVYRANLHLRAASRVLIRAGSFFAATFSELRDRASRLSWERYLQPGQPVAVRAASHKSRLYHSDAVAERVAGAIADRLGKPSPLLKARPDEADDEAPPGPAPQLIVARLVHDRCTLSVDSSGALLHRRGYRLRTAKAPLRETLAAGMLLAAGWDGTTPLLDPFCGAGTIVIEAALLALKRAPGRNRRFAFMHWPGYDEALWQGLLAESADEPPAPPPLIGYDRDEGAIAAARENAERAGVAQAVTFERRAVSDLSAPPGPGWVVTNPPYGVRLRGATTRGPDLRNLYARWGEVLRAQCPLWQVAFLSASEPLQRATGLRFDAGRSVALMNGGLPVRMVRARVPAG